MVNLIGRILILVTIIGILSFGLVTIVNSTSTNSGFDQGEPPQRFQEDQTGTSTQTETLHDHPEWKVDLKVKEKRDRLLRLARGWGFLP